MAYANLAVHAHALKLADFRFTQVEVLTSKFDQRRRNADLLHAVSLESLTNLPVLMWVEGIDRNADLLHAVSLESLTNLPVLMWVEGIDSCVCIQGRILAVGDRIIYLDNDLNVPTHSICRILFN